MSRNSKRKRDAKKRKRGRPASTKGRALRRRFKLAKMWQLETFADGQRMILLRLQDSQSHRFYDVNDRPVPHAKAEQFEGDLWTAQPSTWKGVRDWFRTDTHEGMGASEMPEERYEAWRNTYAANKPFVKLPADDVPPADVAYLVAEGPSLERNRRELVRIDRGVRIAINRTLKHLPPETFEYFFALDFMVDLEDTPEPPYNGPYPETVAIFDPCVSPSLLKHGWKETRWFLPNYDGHHEVYDQVIGDNPQLPRYDMGLSAVYQAVSWIVLGLFGIKPSNDREAVRAQGRGKTLVLVGQDCCYTWGRQRAGKWLMFKDAAR